MAFVKADLFINFTMVIVLGSTLTAASSSNLWDATLLYSKVAIYILELPEEYRVAQICGMLLFYIVK